MSKEFYGHTSLDDNCTADVGKYPAHFLFVPVYKNDERLRSFKVKNSDSLHYG